MDLYSLENLAALSEQQAWPFVFPFLVLLFRLSPAEGLAFHGSYLLIAVLEAFARNNGEDLPASLIGVASVDGVVLVAGLWLSRRYRSTFVEEWRRARPRVPPGSGLDRR